MKDDGSATQEWFGRRCNVRDECIRRRWQLSCWPRMGGNSTLFIVVMVGLAVVLLGTFVLRPSRGGGGGAVMFYAIRLGVVLVALIYGSRHPLHRGLTGGGRDGASDDANIDPFADSGPSVSSGGGDSSGGGPKVMEFNWSTTQRSQ